MIRLFLVLSVLFLSIKGEAQLVKFIKNPVTAQYRVFISDKPAGATHWILSGAWAHRYSKAG